MVLNAVGVTGATGMLGRHIIAALADHQIPAVPVSRPNASLKSQSHWDLLRWGSFEMFDRLFPGVTQVVHAGAYVPDGPVENEADMFDANVRACFNLSEWAKARSVRIIFVSGAIVYKDPYAAMNSEGSMTGFSDIAGLYEWSKIMAEDIFARQAELGLKLSIVRPTSIYGYGLSSSKMLSRFLDLAASKQEIRISRPVMDAFDLIHASDVALAVKALIEKDVDGIFNIGAGQTVSLEEIAQHCVKVAGSGKVVVEGFNSKKRRPRTLFSVNCNASAKQLQWKCMVDLETGLRRMIEKRCF